VHAVALARWFAVHAVTLTRRFAVHAVGFACGLTLTSVTVTLWATAIRSIVLIGHLSLAFHRSHSGNVLLHDIAAAGSIMVRGSPHRQMKRSAPTVAERNTPVPAKREISQPCI
jgi:hypothetical protein